MIRWIALLLLVALCGCSMDKKEKETLAPKSMVLIDVRTPAERAENGYIATSVCVVHTERHTQISDIVPDKSTPVGVYCRSGRRSALAADILKNIGYTDVTDFGGFEDAQKKLSLPVVKVK